MSEMIKTLQAYRYVAAMSTLDKWSILARYGNRGFEAACMVKGLIWHDRYLCGDAERGRKFGGRA